MSKQLTILPSTQITKPVTPTVNVPSVHTGGFVGSLLTTWESNSTRRAVDALTKLDTSKAALFNAQLAVIESTIRRKEALVRLQELPERLGHELAVRRMLRANEFRQVQHVYEVNELTRLTELAHRETELTDARQQLAAQQKYGDSTYELAWKKKHLEMLDVEMNAEERRAVLRQHRINLSGELEGSGEDDAHRRRSEALADGKDAAAEEDADAMFGRPHPWSK